uniref:Uncharacterized protein n=1 Tax=Anopheles merus TaxID=30066 RepID=A0A182UR50_ANOME
MAARPERSNPNRNPIVAKPTQPTFARSSHAGRFARAARAKSFRRGEASGEIDQLTGSAEVPATSRPSNVGFEQTKPMHHFIAVAKTELGARGARYRKGGNVVLKSHFWPFLAGRIRFQRTYETGTVATPGASSGSILELQYIVQCVQGCFIKFAPLKSSESRGLVEGHIRHCSPLTVH